jgi:signal transduction histidine kinase
MQGLKALVKEKDDLIGLFSHDMKSPINQVKGLGQIMLLSLDDKEILKESLAKLDQTANRQLTLYKNILYMLKADQIAPEDKDAKKVSLLYVIKKAVKSLTWETDAKNITTKISIPESIEIYAHLNLFVQAIQNLLSNAIKFSHPGSEVRMVAKENDKHVMLVIEDDGIGFDQEKETVLFNRFTTEGRRGTNNEASTGLGLYLVKKIVENHHGTIRATSKGEGKGSSFNIQLPKAADF